MKLGQNAKIGGNMESNNVLKIILDIAKSIRYNGLILNERYLHHYFSYSLLKNERQCLNLTDSSTMIALHPEWPTYKKQTGLAYGRYKKENNIYLPNKVGSAGFIDFAIGDYKRPDIGIEFSLKYGWSREELVYDFLKLLDKKNPFKVSISLNIIFRQKRLVSEGHLSNLEERMNEAYREAIRRLNGDKCDDSRELYLIVTEIDRYNNRHWYYDKKSNKFKKGLPFIA